MFFYQLVAVAIAAGPPPPVLPPGMTDFFVETFSDGIHLTAKGRYLVSLVHYACIWRQRPEGKAGPLNTGLTPQQLAIFQRIAWQAAPDYKPSVVASAVPASSPAGNAARP